MPIHLYPPRARSDARLGPSRRHSLLWTLAAFACLAWAPDAAQAQRNRDKGDSYVALKLMLGLGGEADVGPLESDLKLTWGGGIAYMHPLHRYFALGGQFAVQSWQTEAGDDLNFDRNLYTDLALVPQGKLPLDGFELYVSVPLGLSVSFPGEDRFSFGSVMVSQVDPALGFTIGVLFGARVVLDGGVGLLAEFGYTAHSYEHEVTILGVSTDWDYDLGQFALHFGVSF
jgi:hypothetical protein